MMGISVQSERKYNFNALFPWLSLGGLLIAVLYSFGFYAWLWSSDGDAGDWSKAADLVAKDFTQGDAIVVSPSWMSFGEKELVTRGLPYFQADHPEDEFIPNAKRLWILSAYGRTDFSHFNKVAGPPLKQAELGRFTIALYDWSAQPQATLSFADHLDQAAVYVFVRDVKQPCPWNPETLKHQCNQEEWHYVGVRPQARRGAVRKSIWAHPVERGELTVVFRNVKLGSRILLQHGLTEWAAREKLGGDIQIDVRTESDQLASFKQLNQPGWNREWIDTAARKNEFHDVSVALKTSGQGRRHFYFEAYVVDE